MSSENTISELSRLLALKAWRAAQGLAVGAWRSRFAGNGLDFSELADYTPGEDARAIHWPASLARHRTLVRRFEESREIPLWLGVDLSRSVRILPDSWRCLCEAVALFSACAERNGDPVCMLAVCQDESHLLRPHGYGARAVQSVLWQLNSLEPHHPGTDLAGLCRRLNGQMSAGARTVLLTDLLCDQSEAATSIRQLAARHDTLVCRIIHHLSLPVQGSFVFEDAENGERLLLDCSQRVVQPELPDCGADVVDLPSPASPLPPLLAYFRRSQRRGRP